MSDLNQNAVAEWLRNNPDFFARQPELLDELQVSRGAGDTVSITDFHLSSLRERNRQTAERLQELSGNARHNEAVFGACRAFIIAILDIPSIDELLHNLEDILCETFDLSGARLVSEHLSHPTVTAPSGLEYLCHDEAVFLGNIRVDESRRLFGAESKVNSAAITPLRNSSRNIGHLALGSNAPTRFERSQGTLFVDFVADALARVMLHHQNTLGAATTPAAKIQPAT